MAQQLIGKLAIVTGDKKKTKQKHWHINKNKTIHYLGAGSGIGRSTCRLLRDYGAKVIAADRNIKAAEETAKELGDRGEYFWLYIHVFLYFVWLIRECGENVIFYASKYATEFVVVFMIANLE